MYIDNERFTAFYDKNQPGTAAFLRDAIHIYTGIKKIICLAEKKAIGEKTSRAGR